MAAAIEHLDAKIIFFFCFLAGCASFPWIPIIYREMLHLTQFEVGIVTSLTPFVALLSAPLWTYIVDVTNKRLFVLVFTSIASTIIQWAYALPGVGFVAACWIAVIQSFFAAPVFALVDALILDLLGDDQDAYGFQRLWAAISCGLTYVITFLGVRVLENYVAAFVLQSFWTAVFLVVLLIVVSRSKKLRKEAVDVDVTSEADEGAERPSEEERRPLMNPTETASDDTEISSFAVVQNFLWLYLREYKDASTLLLGMTGPFTIVVELPFFFFSKSILRRLGMKNCIILGHLAMLTRVLLYTILPSGPWAFLVLGVEMLHGLSFSLMWTAGVRFASSIAPKSMSTTAQGLLNGAHFGLGFGVGSIVAGYAYANYGPVAMFRGSAAALFVSALLMWIFVREPTNASPSSSSSTEAASS
ncbi:major facilitator superfamily domain-containing protein [Chytridium lagenaria]|nr:major facilitator superfamily domain-containing protein [Chytridium lagenaria]